MTENQANEALTATLKENGFSAIAVQRIILDKCRADLIAMRPYEGAGLKWIEATHKSIKANIAAGAAQYGSLEAYKLQLSAVWGRNGGQAAQANSESFGLGAVMAGSAQTEAAGIVADAAEAFARANGTWVEQLTEQVETAAA